MKQYFLSMIKLSSGLILKTNLHPTNAKSFEFNFKNINL